jgi:hypothetical protein
MQEYTPILVEREVSPAILETSFKIRTFNHALYIRVRAE